MRNLKLILEYDGTEFAGWQYQPGQRTVQDEVTRALFRMTGEQVVVFAAGRTDAGVHALGQVASFHTASQLEPRVFISGLNFHLPHDVAALAAAEAPEGWSAKREACGKWYRYLIRDGTRRLALERDRAWRLPHRLDLAAMRAAAAHLIGEHDFSSFRSATCEATSPVKEMRRIEIFRDGEGRVAMEFWASAFLKQMVRSLVGTLVEVGQGKRRAEEMAAMLAACDRRRAGATAPPHGLYLLRVDYREDK